MQPGDRLREVELAERLGISRSPIREALRQLEFEGLVRSLPYKQTEVVGVSQEEIVEVLVPVRLILETFAFRKALPLLTDADIASLKGIVEEMRAATAATDFDAVARADVRFHELVIERSGQPHCLQVWRSIEPRVRAYFRRDAPVPDHDVAGQHEQLLAVLVAGDEASLLEALRHHILIYLTPSDSA